ncbi:MAG: TIGR02444 family protein [Phenylobacterium sp.]|uniref:TIGR02444 family protein n=1 Tax=Phenylobacterium sp. TaxID=1871053 RepID=UPI0008D13FD7|nr:MAG: TIGR02444 family protein [Phenylobacterium sp. RIFCSPHIGHO2_01_FULL_70_10]
MGIWEWALAVYGQEGVSAAALELQDAHGQNVPFLLWAVYAEAGDPDRLAQAADLARRWESAAVKPLRAARRALKPPLLGVAEADREDLRETVKAAELRAERILLEALDRQAGGSRDGASTLEALKAASRAWGAPAPETALAALAGALRQAGA